MLGVDAVTAVPLSHRDPFFPPYAAAPPRFAQRERSRGPGSDTLGLPMTVIALSLGPARAATTTPVAPRSPRLVYRPPAGAGPSRPIERRERSTVAMHPIPLGPGRGAVVAPRRRAVPSAAAPMPAREVRLTLAPTPVSEEPAGTARASVEMIAPPQGSVAPALVRPGAAVTAPSGVPVRMASPFATQALARASVAGGAGAAA